MEFHPLEPLSRPFSLETPDLSLHAVGHAHPQHIRLQKPCYLLGEGYCQDVRELMDTTDWGLVRDWRYEKWRELHAHCGYERRAPRQRSRSPGPLKVACSVPRTAGPMAPEIPLERQRPAEFVFSRLWSSDELAAIRGGGESAYR